MIGIFAVIAFICIALYVVYFLKNKTNSKQENWLWIGPGKDPFKK